MAKQVQSGPRNQVFLKGYSNQDELIDDVTLSYVDYYDGSPELIDSDEYRATRGICRVIGEIYNMDGVLQQRFDNRYNLLGEYVGGRAVHADGTIIEH